MSSRRSLLTAVLLPCLLLACTRAAADDAGAEEASGEATAGEPSSSADTGTDGAGASQTSGAAADRPPTSGVSGGRETVRETLVVVQGLAIGPIRDEIAVSARVESRASVAVFPKLSGLPVTEVLVEEGDRVAAGDPLMRLYDVDLELALRAAQVAAEQAVAEAERAALRLSEEEARVVRAERQAVKAQHDWERLGGLLADGLVNVQEVEDARLLAETAADDLELARFARDGAQVELQLARLRAEAAEVEVERKRSDLGHATLRAPLAGVVARRRVEVGVLSTLGEPAFTLVDLTRPVLNLRVPQDSLPRLAAGQAVEVRAVTNAAARFEGVVRTVNPVLDETSGTVHVVVDLVPRDGLLPGLFCEARIITAARAEALLVDKRAVRWDADQPVLFALDADGASVKRVPFVAGASTPTTIEIVSDTEGVPLAGDLRVVVVGNESLKHGSRVRVREEPY